MSRFDAALIIAAMCAACGSSADNVCNHIGNCAQGGSSDWIQGCKDNAHLLKDEAETNGCRSLFDAYFDCADESFACHGITPSFPGCENAQAALDDCFAAAQSSTACSVLASQVSQCGDVPGNAAEPSEPTTASACTTARDCQAQCFLDSMSNLCAPLPEELSAFADCAARCPTQ